MAKTKVKSQPEVRDRTYYYTDLAFIPSEEKNSLWFAQSLFFAKMNAVPFLDTKRYRAYKALERGEIDRQEYVNIIDPPTPMGGGGKAEYFASDFKTCPIDVHVDNIVRAKLDKICIENELQVNEIDKYSKSQRQRAKDKIIYRDIFREFINEAITELGPESGLTKLGNSESPYDFIKRLNGEELGKSIDNVQVLIDYIGNQIKDQQDMALYETYVYKGDIERAFELGMKHYLFNINKWPIISEHFNTDLKQFNRACGRWYIDLTTGRGVVEYIQPDRLFTSPFLAYDGDDLLYWFYEKDITFADFVRQFGRTLTNEQLKEVFELNKRNGSAHGLDFMNTTSFRRNTALIRIGFFSILTQEASAEFTEEFVNNEIPAWKGVPREWKDNPEFNNKIKQKIYNVWYSCYYIPPPGDTLSKNTPISWQWQQQYIFNIQKDVDMYRYGADRRYARSSLVIWKDDRMSFTDIKEAFMPKIRTNWHKLQNCFVQDTTALAIDWDFIGGLLNAVDEGNKVNPGDPERPIGNNGYDAGMEAWKALKQGGIAFMKFRDKNGNAVVDPSKFFVAVNTQHIEKAEKYIQVILEMYNMMVMALAQNDITQGQTPKPRTPVAAIQAAISASNNGTWFIEKPVREFFIMFGERCLQMIMCFVRDKKKYGYEERWNEFKDVVGLANALMVEGIEEVDPEDLGITVTLEDTTSNKEYVVELANNMAAKGEVGYDAVGLVMETAKQNYKYAYALLMIEKKRKERELADQQELDFQRQSQLQQQQLQIAQALQAAKTQGKQAEIQTAGEVDARLAQIEAQLKLNSMLTQKQQLKENKMEEATHKSDLKKEEEQERAMSPMTV